MGRLETARTQGVGVSLTAHAALLSALLLAPLLTTPVPPEIARSKGFVLFEPSRLDVPKLSAPARPRGSRATGGGAPSRVSLALTPPVETPQGTTETGDVLDSLPDGPTGDGVGTPGTGGDGPGGDCIVGAICGTDPAPTTPPSEPVRVGGLIREPRIISSVAAVYPDVARAAGVPGMVIMEARVGKDGRVQDVKVLRGNPLFDDAATASVWSRRYEPLLLNGVPTEFVLTVTMNFSLKR